MQSKRKKPTKKSAHGYSAEIEEEIWPLLPQKKSKDSKQTQRDEKKSSTVPGQFHVYLLRALQDLQELEKQAQTANAEQLKHIKENAQMLYDAITGAHIDVMTVEQPIGFIIQPEGNGLYDLAIKELKETKITKQEKEKIEKSKSTAESYLISIKSILSKITPKPPVQEEKRETKRVPDTSAAESKHKSLFVSIPSSPTASTASDSPGSPPPLPPATPPAELRRQQAQQNEAKQLFANRINVEKIIQTALYATGELPGDHSYQKHISEATLTFLKAKAVDFEKSVEQGISIKTLERDFAEIEKLIKNNLHSEWNMLNRLKQELEKLEDVLVSKNPPFDYIHDAQIVQAQWNYKLKLDRFPAGNLLGKFFHEQLGFDAQHDQEQLDQQTHFLEIISQIPHALELVKNNIKKIENAIATFNSVQTHFINAKQIKTDSPDQVFFKKENKGGLNVEIQQLKFTKTEDFQTALDAATVTIIAAAPPTGRPVAMALRGPTTPIDTKSFDATLTPLSAKPEAAIVIIKTPQTFNKPEKDYTRIIAGNLPEKTKEGKDSFHPEVRVDHLRKDLRRDDVFELAFQSLTLDKKSLFRVPDSKTFFQSFTDFPVTKAALKKFLEEHSHECGPFSWVGAKSLSSVAGKLVDFYNSQMKDAVNIKCPRSELLDICKLSHDKFLSVSKGEIKLGISGDSQEAKWAMKCYCKAMQLILNKGEIAGYQAKHFDYVDMLDTKNPEPNSKEVRAVADYLVIKFFPEKFYALSNPADARALRLYQSTDGRRQLKREIAEEAADMDENRRLVGERFIKAGINPNIPSRTDVFVSPYSPSPTPTDQTRVDMLTPRSKR